ncbi:MAG: hypothetical protein ACUVTQ_12090 [Desulfotomaculales bacterium]
MFRRKRLATGEWQREPAVMLGDAFFGVAVGRFVAAHVQLMGLWQKLKVDEVARDAQGLAAAAQELAAAAEEVNAAVEEATATHHHLGLLAEGDRRSLAEMASLLAQVEEAVATVVAQRLPTGWVWCSLSASRWDRSRTRPTF